MKFKSLKWFIAIAMIFSFASCSDLDKKKKEDPIRQLIGKMSLKEKVCQMFILRPEALATSEESRDLGYKGIIITDAMGMGAIIQKYTPSEAAIETGQAGVDMITLPEDYVKAVDGIIKAVEDGTLNEKQIDESVYRILALKIKKGLIGNL